MPLLEFAAGVFGIERLDWFPAARMPCANARFLPAVAEHIVGTDIAILGTVGKPRVGEPPLCFSGPTTHATLLAQVVHTAEILAIISIRQ